MIIARFSPDYVEGYNEGWHHALTEIQESTVIDTLDDKTAAQCVLLQHEHANLYAIGHSYMDTVEGVAMLYVRRAAAISRAERVLRGVEDRC